MRGREEYREFHERDHEIGEVGDDLKDDEELKEDCDNCKHDWICQGGCGAGVDCGYKFENIEGEI